MNQSRRTFFKRLGMLAAMSLVARFVPKVKAEEPYCVTPDGPDSGAIPRYKHVTYGYSIPITQGHAIRIKRLSDSVRRAYERKMAQMFNNAFILRY